MEVPGIIIGKLTKEQLDMLKSTCFENFVDVGEPPYFSQIIQHTLVREVYQRDKDEIWFIFSEKRVRFTLPEFCLISGLSWQGNDDISAVNEKENKLEKKYCQDEIVTRLIIKRRYQSVVFDDDEEAVRMSIILLVFNFILATIDHNYVDKVLLNFISYGEFDTYPWGKVAFDQTKNSLSQALKGQVRKDDHGGVVYNFYKERYCKSYKLNGLAFAFQVFLFETIPTLKERCFCIDDQRSEIRLFRWKELGKPPFYEMLNNYVFGSGKLRIEILIPTNDEKELLDLGGFQFSNNSNGGQKRSEKLGKGVYLGFTLSDFKDIVDARETKTTNKVGTKTVKTISKHNSKYQ